MSNEFLMDGCVWPWKLRHLAFNFHYIAEARVAAKALKGLISCINMLAKM